MFNLSAPLPVFEERPQTRFVTNLVTLTGGHARRDTERGQDSSVRPESYYFAGLMIKSSSKIDRFASYFERRNGVCLGGLSPRSVSTAFTQTTRWQLTDTDADYPASINGRVNNRGCIEHTSAAGLARLQGIPQWQFETEICRVERAGRCLRSSVRLGLSYRAVYSNPVTARWCGKFRYQHNGNNNQQHCTHYKRPWMVFPD